MFKGKKIGLWIGVLRPQHWIKSGFCAAALFFSGQAANWERWTQLIPVLVAFSVLASSGYLLNDVWNRKEDQLHPRKKFRPVASGQLGVRSVLLVSAILSVIGLGILGMSYGFHGQAAVPLWHGFAYLGLTASYSLLFRDMPLLDVLVLGVGFVIRVSVGAFAIGVAPTLWILGCTYGLALLLSFGKRLGEWRLIEKRGASVGETRLALRGYTEALLRVLVGAGAAVTGGSYFAYCLSHPEREILILTVIPVIVGLMSYLRLAWRSEVVETPEKLLFRSPLLLGCVVAWLGMIAFVAF
ncbi:MAG: UbiA prenyltransferase family protein [Roseibacillus sp.]